MHFQSSLDCCMKNWPLTTCTMPLALYNVSNILLSPCAKLHTEHTICTSINGTCCPRALCISSITCRTKDAHSLTIHHTYILAYRRSSTGRNRCTCSSAAGGWYAGIGGVASVCGLTRDKERARGEWEDCSDEDDFDTLHCQASVVAVLVLWRLEYSSYTSTA